MHQPKPDEMFWVWVEFGPAQAQTFDLNRKGSFDNMVKYMGEKESPSPFHCKYSLSSLPLCLKSNQMNRFHAES